MDILLNFKDEIMNQTVLVLLMFLGLSSCSTQSPKNKEALKEVLIGQSETNTNTEIESESEVEANEELAASDFTLVPDEEDQAFQVQAAPERREKKFSLEYLPSHYSQWVEYFSIKDKARFLRFLANANKYRTVIENIFEEHGLPKELFFVGLIESGYYMRAKSHAGAQGPWQFMKGTGKHYGLRVDQQVDERMNIFKATHAAANYFKDLYNIFGSWELALCGYNAGEYRVIGAIRKGNTRSYKELVKKKLLPAETIHYVPKMAAAMRVTEELHQHSNKQKELSLFYSKTKAMKINKSFTVDKLSRSLGISKEHFLALNHDLKSNSIKVKGYHRLYIPSQNTNAIKLEESPSVASEQLIQEKNTEDRPRQIASKGEAKKKVHVVKKGQNLTQIAKKYKLSVAKLKAMNNLKKNAVYSGQKLKVMQSGPLKHIVKAGENLHHIARKYEIPVWSLKKANRLKREVLWVGQILKIPVGSALVVEN
jgi:membrane-bound lytic murein transglycosylase D